MIRSSLAVALMLYSAFAAVVLRECVFLAPLKARIWRECSEFCLYFSILMVLNLFAAVYSVFRRVALKHTGDKLSHLEKQLRGRFTVSEELTERILNRE